MILSRAASGATLSLASAPGAQLLVGSLYVDLSTRLQGSLSAEPLGEYQGIRFSLATTGPIVIDAYVPGRVAEPMTIRINELTWETPGPAALPSLAPPIGSGAIVPFPSYSARLVGSVEIQGYLTPFDVIMNEGILSYPAPATAYSVFVPTANSIVIGGGASTAGPSFSVHASGYPGNHIEVDLQTTLFTQGLLFVPEPGSLALVTAGFAALSLARSSKSRGRSGRA